MARERLAWGIATFADDLRYEMGGKFSLMGVYHSEILIPVTAVFPIIIPKLAIVIDYNEVKDTLDDDLEFKVFFPGQGEAVMSMPVPRAQLKQAPPPKTPDADSEPLYSVRIPLLFSPVQLMSAGPIKVRAFCGDKVFRLGRIEIRVMSEAEQANLVASVSQQPLSPPPPAAPAS